MWQDFVSMENFDVYNLTIITPFSNCWFHHCCRGEDVFISLWNLHRAPHLWENPEDFNPERWPLDQPAPTEVNQDYRYLPLPFILNSSGHVWAFVESFSFCRSNYDVVWWGIGRYLPFGGGQRKCLGDMFATFEVCNFTLAVMSLRDE
jgi:beta-ring hydroxylase